MEFLTLISNKRRIYYSNYEARQYFLRNNLNPDSSLNIAKYFSLYPCREVLLDNYFVSSKNLLSYEYNPLTQELAQTSGKIDLEEYQKVKNLCKNLDFKQIVPNLIIKPLVRPLLSLNTPVIVSIEHKKLLNEWKEVADEITYSGVRDLIKTYCGKSVRDLVWITLSKKVQSNINLEKNQNFEKTFYAYISSFFDFEEFKKFRCLAKLWEEDLFPIYEENDWKFNNSNILFQTGI